MKNFLILFFLIFCTLSAFANIENNNNKLEKQYAEQKQLESAYGITFADSNYEYKPIPKELQTQYKVEIERYINTQVPIAKKEIEKEVKKARKLYKKFLNDKNSLKLKNEYLEKLNTYWQNAYFLHTQIYIDLINITKKYVDINNLIPATGAVQELDLFIFPYLEKNNIKNAGKIIDLYKFSSIADKKIFYLINLIPNY